MAFNLVETAFSYILGGVFLFFIGTFIGITTRGILRLPKSSNSPRIPVQARVVTKRTYTGGRRGDTAAAASYYITFEFPSGNRKELYVPHQEFGLIDDGDDGILTSQGSRFISFERNAI